MTHHSPNLHRSISISMLTLALLTAIPGRVFAQSLLVCSGSTNSVIEYRWPLGSPVGAFVTSGSGGLSAPKIIRRGPSGNFFATSFYTDSVLEYSGTTGAFVRTFVAAGQGGLNHPYSLAFGPNGNVYVSSQVTTAPTASRVIQYNGTTGATIGTFVTIAGDNGTSIGLTFGSNGNLYVGHFAGNRAIEFDGVTGTQVRTFTGGGLSQPLQLAIAPNGNLLVCSTANDKIAQFTATGI